MESCLSGMETSLFDKYLRLCTVAAAIRLSLCIPLKIESPVAGLPAKAAVNLASIIQASSLASQLLQVCVGFDTARALRQSARPLIKPIPLSAGGSRRLPDGLFSLAQRYDNECSNCRGRHHA